MTELTLSNDLSLDFAFFISLFVMATGWGMSFGIFTNRRTWKKISVGVLIALLGIAGIIFSFVQRDEDKRRNVSTAQIWAEDNYGVSIPEDKMNTLLQRDEVLINTEDTVTRVELVKYEGSYRLLVDGKELENTSK